MSKDVIIWPVYNDQGKVVKCGRLNGVPFKTVWNQCSRWADKYIAAKIKESTN